MATCIVVSSGVVSLAEAQDQCLFYAVDSQTWAKLQEVIAPTLSLDYVQLAAVWAFFFTFVLSLYLFSHGCQHIVEAVRKS